MPAELDGVLVLLGDQPLLEAEDLRAVLDAWARRALDWSQGEAPSDLPYAGTRDAAPVKPRDTFVFFISAAKERNPAAAMALQQRLADAKR